MLNLKESFQTLCQNFLSARIFQYCLPGNEEVFVFLRDKSFLIMHERHVERKQYFEEQSITTKKFVIPYINEILPVTPELSVAEIGCGEGGNMAPFLDLGCKVFGIDIAENKIQNAKLFFEGHPNEKNLTLIAEDIYKLEPGDHLKFDLILMRDTLEHIPDQQVFLAYLKKFLKPHGKVFIAFPPWRMPFGGHQQICESRFLSKLPYYHILPVFLYKSFLKLFGESGPKIKGLLEVKETGISLFRFKKILKQNNYFIDKETMYLINPNYEVKFKLKTRKLPVLLNIPYLRDFYTTTYYCIISNKTVQSDLI